MKSIINIIVTALVLITCSAISMYAVVIDDAGTGTVNLTVIQPLHIHTMPITPTPNGDEPTIYIAQGDYRDIESEGIQINYEIFGEPLMGVSFSNNGNGVDLQGTGTPAGSVSLGTGWHKTNSSYGANYGWSSTATLSSDNGDGSGSTYYKCKVLSVSAGSNASLVKHYIQLTLTAAYSY